MTDNDVLAPEIVMQVYAEITDSKMTLRFPDKPEEHKAVFQNEGLDTSAHVSIIEVRSRMSFLNDRINDFTIPEGTGAMLGELNFLAGRMARMSDYERLAFEGLSRIHNAETPSDYINITYNLDNADLQGGICSLAMLGEDAIESLKALLPAGLHGYLDAEAAGRQLQEEMKGVFADGVYVTDADRNEFAYMYDGGDFPDVNEFGTHFFRLTLASADAYKRLGDQAPTFVLKLPEKAYADDAKWLACHKLGVFSLDHCVITGSECIEPRFENLLTGAKLSEAYDFSIDLLTVTGNEDHLPLFFATLEYLYGDTKVTLAQAREVLELSHDFELYYNAKTPEDYAKALLCKQLPAAQLQAALPVLDLKRCGEDRMRECGAVITSEGILIPPEDLRQEQEPKIHM